MGTSPGERADAYDEIARRSLRNLGPEPRNWVPPRRDLDHNVLIVGGGQCGIAAAFALRRAGIGSVAVIDRNSASEPGIWLTKARMRTLRTQKDIPGPEIHNPVLGFRAWYTAQYGDAAFDDLDRIPREEWARYLLWFRRIAAVETEQNRSVERIEEAAGHLRVTLEDGSTRTTRKIVLATGYAGNGGPSVPSFVSSLPGRSWAHSDSAIDFSALAGKIVGVVGSASSAFDNAAVALEAGAAEVHLLCRAPDLNRGPKFKTGGYVGVSDNFFYLPDAVRWQVASAKLARSNYPVAKVVRRACLFPAFRIHLGAAIERAETSGGRIVLGWAGRQLSLDYLIAATGYRMDPLAIPELASLSPGIVTWKERPDLPEVSRPELLGNYPYLGPNYQYRPRAGARERQLRNIHVVNLSALVSFGRHVGDIGSLRAAIPRLVRGISRDLFLEDQDAHATRMMTPEELLLDRANYEGNVASGPALANA